MRHTVRFCALFLLTLSLATYAAPSFYVSVDSPGLSFPIEDQQTHPTSVRSYYFSGIQSFDVQSVAAVGAVGTLSNTFAQVNEDHYAGISVYGSAQAEWIDRITINSATASGTGIWHLQVEKSIAFAISDPRFAGVSYGVTVQKGLRNASGLLSNATTLYGPTGGPNLLDLAIPFTYGTPFDLRFSTAVSSGGQSFTDGGPGDLSSSFALAMVRLAGTLSINPQGASTGPAFEPQAGSPLPDFQILSESNIDYTQSYAFPTFVPEPATTLMLFPLLLLQRRRNQHRATLNPEP